MRKESLKASGPTLIDVDFSLAIHNRTGKYFIGRDLLEVGAAVIGKVYYCGVAFAAPPVGWVGRIIAKLQYLHADARNGDRAMTWLPRWRARRPMLHLDPFTVASTRVRRDDAVLCHDLGPLTHPELFDADVCAVYRSIYREIAAVGPHIIFVSRSTQLMFERIFPFAAPASSRVIYPALRAELDHQSDQPVAELIGHRFLLTVGSIGARKNQRRCIDAFRRSGLAGQGVRYVLCGAREPGWEAVKMAASSTAGVVILPYVSDEQLGWLYRHAGGFVLASLLEGFGIPVAEAIARGLVPLVTCDSVLHEVAGNGALLADAEDEGEIAEGMALLASMSDAERGRRMALLQAAIKRFSPDLFARDWALALAVIAAEEPR